MLSVVLVVGLCSALAVMADEKPRRGDLNAALAANPQPDTCIRSKPSQWPNRWVLSTQPDRLDPHNYPDHRRPGQSGGRSLRDYLTYTFTLHQGVTFHDGSPLTSADVKASWDRIIFPPEGVVSPRRGNYPMVKSIEAPDPYTVVFHLQHRSPSFLINLAHPASFIYAKKYLDEDQQWYKKNTMGSGPFKLKQYVHGASFEMERNAKYWKPGLPYMDGIKYYIITDDGARGKASAPGAWM